MSGVTFVIVPESPSARAGDTTYYFCCQACLDYFRAHTRDVLAKRGLPA